MYIMQSCNATMWQVMVWVLSVTMIPCLEWENWTLETETPRLRLYCLLPWGKGHWMGEGMKFEPSSKAPKPQLLSQVLRCLFNESCSQPHQPPATAATCWLQDSLPVETHYWPSLPPGTPPSCGWPQTSLESPAGLRCHPPWTPQFSWAGQHPERVLPVIPGPSEAQLNWMQM